MKQVKSSLAGVEISTIACQIRRLSLQMIYQAGSGHPGGALSAADILSVLYFRELQINPTDATWPERDRFIMSKGHSCPALYAALRLRGCLEANSAFARRPFRKINGALQGHPHVVDLPWVETSTGSLGQGFSAAIGMALGLRYRVSPARVYVMLGDGEMQEGEVWEGAMFAGHYKLDNLCGIVDYNKMQSDDFNENIMGLEPLRAKWEAFNWYVVEIDGHNFDEIGAAFAEARQTKGRPTMIIAHTIKGKGISFMEGSPLWHGSLKLQDEELVQALRDLVTPEVEIARYLDGTIWNCHNKNGN